MTKLRKVHECGINQPDFEERNVLSLDGAYRIISFHRVEQHQCRHTYNFLESNGRYDDAWETACPLLYEVADAMDFWNDGKCTATVFVASLTLKRPFRLCYYRWLLTPPGRVSPPICYFSPPGPYRRCGIAGAFAVLLS